MKQRIQLCTSLFAMMMLVACSSGGGAGGQTTTATPVISNTPSESTISSTPSESTNSTTTPTQPAVIPVLSKENYTTNIDVIVVGKDSYGTLPMIAEGNVKSNAITVNGATITDNKIDFAQYGQGNKTLDFTQKSVVEQEGKEQNIDATGKIYLFQQNYSAMVGLERSSIKVDGQESLDGTKSVKSYALLGETTKNLPTTGTYTYMGDVQLYGEQNKAYTGKFNYTVDFTTATGKGNVLGVDGADIVLKDANIQSEMRLPRDIDREHRTGYGIEGDASYKDKQGYYQLGFFGENADEVTGKLSFGEQGQLEGAIGGKKQ